MRFTTNFELRFQATRLYSNNQYRQLPTTHTGLAPSLELAPVKGTLSVYG